MILQEYLHMKHNPLLYMNSTPSCVANITLILKSVLCKFLGFIKFYWCFIPNQSKKVKPLNDLLKKGVPFEWKEGQENTFRCYWTALYNMIRTYIDLWLILYLDSNPRSVVVGFSQP